MRTVATYKLAELDGEVAIGDVVEARVKWMNNPMGELDLEVKGLRAERERESIWRELISARDSGSVVKGRLLNAVNGGYAVGIAGVIAFLPMRAYRGRKPPTTVEAALREAKETGKKPESPVIGDLLGFKILKMTASGDSYRNIVVSGPLGGGSADRRGEAKKLVGDDRLIFTLHGDGELQEGQIWEAALYAGAKKVDNLISTIDANGQQIDGSTDDVMPMGDIGAKFAAFGWDVMHIENGNDLEAIRHGLRTAISKTGHGKPICIVMRTAMGFGVDFMAGTHKWHGIAPSDDQLTAALAQLPETLGDYPA